MNISEFINKLETSGRNTFTKEEIDRALSISNQALNQTLWRTKKQKRIAEPHRGFFIIIHPAYQTQGCLPPEQFIDELMQHLKLSVYYVSLLSAAQFYGATHQKPQALQVIIPEKRRPIHCGATKIIFITKHNIDKLFIKQVKTDQGYFNLSTPEATMIDLVLYPNRCAGWNNVLTVLSELTESININKLIKLIEKITKNAPLQRLGFLLEKINATLASEAIYKYLKSHRNLTPQPLIFNQPTANSELNKKWQLYINEEIEGDL
ncbi:MAG: type IV toxin-antitoxin system AbiEi family antitoxin [Gammaproteobacteria bacterium]|jgi:predicted transcriptional regulator of viral defense system